MPITTKQELLAALDAEWLAFNTALDDLSDQQLSEYSDAQGWTGKDHIAHLAAWERSAAYYLEGKPRHQALEVDEALYLTGDFEAMNTAMQKHSAIKTLAEVRADLLDAHDQLLQALRPVTDADLHRPYSYFQPNEPGEETGRTALDVVVDNSLDHYREHLPWIETLARP